MSNANTTKVFETPKLGQLWRRDRQSRDQILLEQNFRHIVKKICCRWVADAAEGRPSKRRILTKLSIYGFNSTQVLSREASCMG